MTDELYTATARRLLGSIMIRVTVDFSDPAAEPLEVLRVMLRGDGWQHVTMVPGDFPAGSITAELVRHGYIPVPPDPDDDARDMAGARSGDWTWIPGVRAWTTPVEPYSGRPRRGIVTLPPGSVLPPI